jgi:hypothetical protein
LQLNAQSQTWSGQGLMAVPGTSLMGRIGASISGHGGLFSNPFVIPGGSQLYTGVGSLNVAATLRMPVQAVLVGAAAMTNPAALLWFGGSARWSGAGQLSSSLTAAFALAGQLQGAGRLDATLHADYPVLSQLAGSGQLLVTLLIRSITTGHLIGVAPGTLRVTGQLQPIKGVIGQQPGALSIIGQRAAIWQIQGQD